jgi:hypothetical protein
MPSSILPTTIASAGYRGKSTIAGHRDLLSKYDIRRRIHHRIPFISFRVMDGRLSTPTVHYHSVTEIAAPVDTRIRDSVRNNGRIRRMRGKFRASFGAFLCNRYPFDNLLSDFSCIFDFAGNAFSAMFADDDNSVGHVDFPKMHFVKHLL